MAHNLNKVGDKVSFFSVKEKAWHGLGTILEKCPTSKEAIELAGLNYHVGKVPIYGKVGTDFKEVPDRFATYRTDSNIMFGVVGSRYEVVQNVDAFEFFDAIVGNDEAIYETAGCLNNGETVFITAKLPGYIRVGRNDDIEKYLLLTMAHDGTASIQAMFTPIRVVCNNTLSYALSTSKHKVTVRHTKSAKDNLREAHKILGISNQLSNELNGIFNLMSKTKLEDKEVKRYIDQVVLSPADYSMVYLGKYDENNKLIETTRDEIVSTRAENTINGIEKYYYCGYGQNTETTTGTLFGAYNAVTGYLQNIKKYSDEESKMVSIFDGTSKSMSEKAFSLAKQIMQLN